MTLSNGSPVAYIYTGGRLLRNGQEIDPIAATYGRASTYVHAVKQAEVDDEKRLHGREALAEIREAWRVLPRDVQQRVLTHAQSSAMLRQPDGATIADLLKREVSSTPLPSSAPLSTRGTLPPGSFVPPSARGGLPSARPGLRA